MKKIWFSAIFVLICLLQEISVSAQFDKVLSDIISDYGTEQVAYADELNFENRQSLFVVLINGNKAECRIYDDADGIQLTDSLTLPVTASLSVVTKDGRSYILNGTSDFFVLENDSFRKNGKIVYDSITQIAENKNGKITIPNGGDKVTQCLNRLKERTFSEYPLPNKLSDVPAEEQSKIKTTLSACADLMSFDIKNYDYDKIFKYVLYTHQNFKILTDLDPMTGSSSSLGYNNVSIVSSGFIDFIMNNILHITPEKPPVNSLLGRGFCYSGGYYYYTGGFDVFLSTAINDLIGIYDLGDNTILVIFSDVYTEGDTKTSEYSFAVLQKTDEQYSLLRLGMGESLPSADEIRQYSPAFRDTKSEDGRDTKKAIQDSKLMLPVLLLIISVGIAGIIGFIFAVRALIRSKRM